MKNKERVEIWIPEGYEIEEMLELDGELREEKPILAEEVRIRFERRTDKQSV